MERVPRIAQFFHLLPLLLFSNALSVPKDSVSVDSSGVSAYATHSITREKLNRLPVRDPSYYLSLLNGVVRFNDELHVRGGRPHDVGSYLNGIPMTNRFLGAPAISLIPEAIETFTLHPGGAGAAYGYSIGGVTDTRLRAGGEQLTLGVNIHTDNVVNTGKEFLGTTSFGFRNTVLTAGGPVPGVEQLRFFFAAENHYMRNRQPMFLEPMRFDLVADPYSLYGEGRLLPGPVAVGRNFVPNNRSERNTIQGTMNYDLASAIIGLSGSYQFHSYTDGAEWPRALERMFNQRRTPLVEEQTGFLSASLRHEPVPRLSYNASVTYYSRASTTVDPDFGTDWKKYTDSLENAAHGYSGFQSRWGGPHPYSVVRYFWMNHENQPNTTFSKSAQRAWILSASASASPDEDWTVRVGGDIELWEMRFFKVGRIESFMIAELGYNGTMPREFQSEQERRALLGRSGRVNHYGYTVDGDPADSGFDAPATPTFASAYMEHTLSNNMVRISAGLRFEHFNPKFKVPANPANPDFHQILDVLDEEKFVQADPSNHFLPRFSFSFAATRSTILRTSFGKYVQMPPLMELYAGNAYLSRTISSSTRGAVYLPPVGWYARPERSTQYEVGLSQVLTAALRLNASVFHKDIDNLLYVTREAGGNYAAFVNGDEASVAGLELGLEVSRSGGLAAQFFYTLSDARGIASNPRSNIGRAEQRLPIDLILSPLDFQQTHKATLILDYLVAQDEGDPVFSGFNASFVASFASGHRYTRVHMPTFGGLTNEWNGGVKSLVDPRSARPLEPINQSTPPPTFTIDLRIGKELAIGPVAVELYAIALNLLNAKHTLNVYPTTGSAQDDGWLANPMIPPWLNVGQYAEFYRAINLQNRWAYMSATGNDLYGSPRQIRFGMSASL